MLTDSRDWSGQPLHAAPPFVPGDETIRTRPQDGVGKGSNSLIGAVKSLLGK